MRVKILGQVNSRTPDGRVFSAMEGTITEVDDSDDAMVTLMMGFVARGVAEIVKVKPEPATPAKTTTRMPTTGGAK